MLDSWLFPNATELTVAILLAFGTDRIVHLIWNRYNDTDDILESAKASGGGKPGEGPGLHGTFVYGALQSVSISARVYVGLIVTELLLERFPNVWRGSATRKSFRASAPAIAFTIWAGLTLCTVKRIILLKSVAGRKLGRVVLLDHLLNFIIFLLVVLVLLDELEYDLSVGIQSVLSAGGVGALIFSLASKDLAEQIVGGIALGAWDAFAVGDKIRLQDGTEGIVLEIGLTETHIQQYDNIVVRIPNSQLTRLRVSNMSRIKRSRLLQDMRFQYTDLDKLTDVLEEIKEEIRLSCPKLIKDGSKPFYAVLTEYQPDHIKGMIMAHFDIPPNTAAFKYNQQDFVLAIARAMKKHGVEFALPCVVYQGKTLAPGPFADGSMISAQIGKE